MKETREGESLEILDVTSTLCVQSDLFLALLLLDSLSRIYPVHRILLGLLTRIQPWKVAAPVLVGLLVGLLVGAFDTLGGPLYLSLMRHMKSIAWTL